MFSVLSALIVVTADTYAPIYLHDEGSREGLPARRQSPRKPDDVDDSGVGRVHLPATLHRVDKLVHSQSAVSSQQSAVTTINAELAEHAEKALHRFLKTVSAI